MVFFNQFLITAFAGGIAVLAAYVYTVQPGAVWGLLLLCAVCHLLQKRARQMFDAPAPVLVPIPAPRRETTRAFALSNPVVCAVETP